MRRPLRTFPLRWSRIGAVLAVGTAALAAAVSGGAAPTVVTLQLTGAHPVDKPFHVGTFTAPAPLCASGTWTGNGTGTRAFTCADGSGTFIARFNADIEHVQGSTGAWAIVDGSGPYSTIRGAGTSRIDSSTTDASGGAVFSDTWTGVVDSDVTPPSGSITAVKLTRPSKATGVWRGRVSFAAADDIAGNSVSYEAQITGGTFFALRTGTVPSKGGSFHFAFHRERGVRALRNAIALHDPVGNTTTLRKKVKLPSG